MSEDPGPAADVTPIVHGLLVCRNARTAAEGRLNLEEVLEVVALDALPGDAGPLTFVAFVRHLPAGPGKLTFHLSPAGHPDRAVGRYPLQFEVPPGFEGRQIALQMRLPSVPARHGGWYDVRLEWKERVLAVNRFAIGARADGSTSAGDD